MDLRAPNQLWPKLHNVTICFPLNPKIYSRGLILEKASGFLEAALPVLEFQITLIFFLSQAFHFFLKCIGITTFVSQVLSGLILGPTCLGRPDVMGNAVFTRESQDVLRGASSFGFSLFMFLVGVKMDLGMIPNTGKRVLLIGLISYVSPLLFGLSFAMAYARDARTLDFILMQSVTSFPVISNLMSELKLTNTELGRLGLSSALVGDIMGLSVVIFTSIITNYSATKYKRNGAAVVCYLLALVLVFRPLMLRVVKRLPSGMSVSSGCVFSVVGIALASQAYFKMFIGAQYVGPFLIGLAVPHGPPLGSAFVDRLETVISAIFVPLSVATSMMRADLKLIITDFLVIKDFMIGMFLIMSVKLAACLAAPLFCKLPRTDALVLSLIMSCKGIVELASYTEIRDIALIPEGMFAASVLGLLINATINPILVKWLYDPSCKYACYQARSVTSLKPEDPLQILACIHKADNVTPVLKLLDILHPTRESPINVYVLHLIELIGQATPVFMIHQKLKPSAHISQNVISSFNSYERSNWGLVSVHNFTAISPSELMYEDICALALKELISLILIPFHRKWSIDGSIESEDLKLRALNCRVLERAPCSVGIFFNPGKIIRQGSKRISESTVTVCMLFFGGRDDCEALSLAKRMVDDPRVSLTVVHFLPDGVKGEQSSGELDEDGLLDSQQLRDVQENTISNKIVNYLEHKVRGGSQTAKLIRSMAEKYNLFIVGRRRGTECPQTIGLSDWSEFPELGVIGDLLASKDFNIKASVLVVQQQVQMK